jgi:hypothetical protein
MESPVFSRKSQIADSDIEMVDLSGATFDDPTVTQRIEVILKLYIKFRTYLSPYRFV